MSNYRQESIKYQYREVMIKPEIYQNASLPLRTQLVYPAGCTKCELLQSLFCIILMLLCQHLPKRSLSLLILTAFLIKEKSVHNEVFNSVGVADVSHVTVFKKDSSY